MEKHPNRQPRSAEPVHSGDDYDGECDEQFEGNWIYDGTSVVLYTKKDAKRCQRNASNLSMSSEWRKQFIGRPSRSVQVGKGASGATSTSLAKYKLVLQVPH